jgi:hypothetical protein
MSRGGGVFPRSLRAAALAGMVVVAGTAGARGAEAVQKSLPARAPGAVSIGEFLVRYARVVGVRLPKGAGPAEAVLELKSRGLVTEPVETAAVLTEGDVVRFASQAGLRLRTGDERRVFAADKLEPFFQTLGGVMGDPAAGGGSDGSVLAGTDCDPDLANCGDGSDRAREKRKKKKEGETESVP